jgi:hypothetical protein
MPFVGGSPIYTDADGYLHLPGQPPVRFVLELREDAVTHVAVLIKDEITDVGTPMERTVTEADYVPEE